jgi:hypothetical protein
MKAFAVALGEALFSLMLASAACAADDCPAAVSGRGGYVLERDGQSRTEVSFGDGAVVRSVSGFRGKTFLETRQYEGLIQLERLDKGRRTAFRPRSDLAKLFPLKPRQQISLELDVEGEGAEASVVKLDLRMVGADSLAIGACNYDVLKFERTEASANRKNEPVTEYYAPELKFIVAKEYRERDGRTTLVKFDRIYPAGR